MTAVLPEPQTSPLPNRAPAAVAASTKKSMLQYLKPLIYWRWIQTLLLLGIAGTLYYDRYTLCKQYLFKYTDEDQALMWSAAHDLITGHLYEPCFYGQDYNSCIEGYLAVPLIWAHVPYNVAVPLVTVILGLLPYLLLAYVAWRRGQALAAAVCLLIPTLLPTRFAIITGIPRGFVTGLAFATFPALLLLPPPPRPRRTTTFGEEPRLIETRKPRWLRRSWPALRYFFAAFISCFAAQLNPSCALLLGPVAVFAILTTWREWKFWVYGLAGLLAGLPILIYVYQFYHIYHTDYVWYLRDKVFTWSMGNYNRFLWGKVAPPAPNVSLILSDLVPIRIAGTVDATLAVIIAFSVVTLLLMFRLRIAAVAAAFTGVVLTFLSFAYDRVDEGRAGNYAAFAYTRMYLAIPALFVWLLFLVNSTPWPRFTNTPLARWFTRGALIGCLFAGIFAVQEKAKALPVVLARERQSYTCRPVPVAEIYDLAREVQRCADATGADIVICYDKSIGYALPALTTCESLIPNANERRAWRLIQENSPRHDKMLLIEVGGGTTIGGGTIRVDINGNRVDRPPPIPASLSKAVAGSAAIPGRGSTAVPEGRGRGSRGESVEPSSNLLSRFFSNGSAANDGSRVVDIPSISIAATNGHSVNLALSVLGVNVPRIYTPVPTPANPHPIPMVTRQPWNH